MIKATLVQLEKWYNEPTQGGDRPKLLSKLAILELCGWIEGELDRLTLLAEIGRLNDSAWVKENVISGNSGFHYDKHLRSMLCRIAGEILVRRIEQKIEIQNPGELERLKSLLGTLWNIRCNFAHADMHANVAAQSTFYAPSWCVNQHKQLEKLLGKYEEALQEVLNQL